MNEIKIDTEEKNNKKGFTLIELLSAIILLAIVMSISTVSVIGVINKSKSKSYDALIEYAKIGAKSYFEECDSTDIVGSTKINCDQLFGNKLTTTFGDLLSYGFLVGSSKSNGSKIVENPYNNENMNDCQIIVEKKIIGDGIEYEYTLDNRYECSKVKNADEVVNTPSNNPTETSSNSPTPTRVIDVPTVTPRLTPRPSIAVTPKSSTIIVVPPVQSPKLELQ